MEDNRFEFIWVLFGISLFILIFPEINYAVTTICFCSGYLIGAFLMPYIIKIYNYIKNWFNNDEK